MPVSAPAFAKPVPPASTRPPLDRRHYKRVKIDMLGRFMRASKLEYPCRLIEISAASASILSPVEIPAGERVVAYFDQFGGLEGYVERPIDGGFSYNFSNTQHRREKLVATLMFVMNRHELPGIEGRRHARVVPLNNLQTLTLAGDLTVECKVIDISLSGASIQTTARPPLQAAVILGTLKATVVRHHDAGIAVQFTDVQQPHALRRDFG